MFLGEYAHTIDDKGRLTIPSKYRQYLAAGLVVTRGLDRCIAAYPMEAWKTLAEKILALPSTPKPSREYSRLIFSAASDLQPDRQGRILIPTVLYSYAEIETEAILIGRYDTFEIWSPKRWAEYRVPMEKDAEFIDAKLAEYRLAI